VTGNSSGNVASARTAREAKTSPLSIFKMATDDLLKGLKDFFFRDIEMQTYLRLEPADEILRVYVEHAQRGVGDLQAVPVSCPSGEKSDVPTMKWV